MDGFTAAHYAVRGSQSFAFRLLVDNGLDLAPLRSDRSDSSIVFLLAESSATELVVFLRSAGFDLSPLDSNHRTPLHIAAAAANSNMALSLLMEGEVNPCLKDKKGRVAKDLYLQEMRKRFPGINRKASYRVLV